MTKYRGLDDKEYNIRLKKTSNKFKSKYHIEAYTIIKSLYPFYTVYEETKLPGCSSALYLDFFIPNLGVGVEVQGAQHYKYVPHFHTNIVGYAQAIARDKEKKEWCELNEITLVELPYNESIDQWKQRLSL